MNIVLKTTLKNIFGKPLRTFLVVFSIFVCSFVAMFCFDFGMAEKSLIMDLYSKIGGNANLVMTLTAQDADRIPEDFPEYEKILVHSFADYIYCDIEGEPMYATRKDLTVYGVNFDDAQRMALIGHYELADGYTIITDKVAEDMDVEEGDTVILHDNRGDGHEFIVSQIVESSPMSLLMRDYSALINENDSEMMSCGKPGALMVMIDLMDDTQAENAQMILEQVYPNAAVQNFTIDSTTQGMLDQVLGMMFLVFAVTFLLVVFITASICERIVCERMSFVGTLRSLGMDSRRTGFILLLENLLYAILGSVPAVVLYSLIRGSIYGAMLTGTTSDGQSISFDAPSMPMLLPAGVVIGAAAIECFIPLRAVLRALRISIRDIIFDNRDTEYKFSKTGCIIGLAAGVLSVILFFFRSNMFLAAFCLIFGVISLAFLFPFFLKLISGIITLVAAGSDKERWALASRETISKKSTVTSGVLCATSSAMCVIVFSIAMAMIGMFGADRYHYDVRVTLSSKPENYSYVEYLDEVEDYEYVYNKMEILEVNGEEKVSQVYGLPDGGFTYYTAVYDLPSSLNEGEICIERSWARRNGLNIGDTMTITFDPHGVFPIEKTFTVVSFFNIDSYDSMNNNFVISQDEFISIYHDLPYYLLIRTSDPDGVADLIKTYSVGSYVGVATRAELIAEDEQSSVQIRTIFSLVIIVALVMTCIGMISNQLIGFDGRRKECAVMLSTSMDKRTLSGILFREMFITSAVSGTLGTLIGTALIYVVKAAVDYNDAINLPLNINVPAILLIWAAMIVLFALTVLFPIKNLRKMKIAEQIKYE